MIPLLVEDNFVILKNQSMLEPVQECKFPQMKLSGYEIVPLIQKHNVDCMKESMNASSRIFDVDKGTRILRRLSKSKEHQNCCYRPIFRISDDYRTGQMYCKRIKVSSLVLS
jgi:hypothetical protein